MQPERFIATILFTDIVSSTERATELGDRGWRDLLAQHHEIVRQELSRFQGREIATAGDGFLAVLDGTTRGILCASAIRDAVEELGLQVRCGLHMGQVEREAGGDIGGISVHVGARVVAEAEAGEVLVSGTVRDAELGSGFGFDDRGQYELKGVPGQWTLYAVTRIPEEAYERQWEAVAQQFVPQTEAGKSIAVLPFANLSADPENEYFSDGVTETILTTLSRVRDLKVISRTSVMRLKGTTKSLHEIASELGVAHVVQGAVQRSGNRVRITTQLIDARTDEHRWAETYDRDLEDIFAIQSDVAERIVGSLQAVLTPVEKAQLEGRLTESVEAYELYLKGRHFLALRMGAALGQAVEWFRGAVEADPEFAQAWAGLANAYALLPYYADASTTEIRSQARAAAEQALAIDPCLGEPHAALGVVAQTAWDWEETEREFRRALELSPGSATAHQWYGSFLVYRGEHDEAIALLEHASEVDPLSLPIHAALGVASLCARRYDRAEAIYRKGLELDPNFVMLHNNLAHLYEVQGRYEEALAEMETSARLNPDWVSLDRVAAERTGYAERGERGYWEADLEWKRSQEWSPRRAYGTAVACAALGWTDEAFVHLDRLVDSRHPVALQIAPDPHFDLLRSEPRFAAILDKIGLGRSGDSGSVSASQVVSHHEKAPSRRGFFGFRR
jgi:TolB-like protein/Tfp pilus assembly protein PilF